MDRVMELRYAAAEAKSAMDRSYLGRPKMQTEDQRTLRDHDARRLAETKAIDLELLSDEALRAKAEEFRRRLLAAKEQKTG